MSPQTQEQIPLLMKSCADAVNQRLSDIFDDNKKSYGCDNVIDTAMRYGCLNGGKRIRPFLLIQTASLFNIGLHQSLHAAAAIEMVHSYSLIHDDLPAMDDDDTRRGQPTLHKKFDEATAILAGDALLTLAFETLASEQTAIDASTRCVLIMKLAKASGAYGMVGGQMLDLLFEKQDVYDDMITHMQHLKTGCLFDFSCQAATILGNATQQETQALYGYSQQIGLLFQITDDLLDYTGDSKIIGKKIGKDASRHKASIVASMGITQAQQHCQMLSDQACAHLKIFGRKATILKKLAKFIINRVA